MIKQRGFIMLLGGSAAAGPLAARAQHSGKLPIIGFLVATAPTAPKVLGLKFHRIE